MALIRRAKPAPPRPPGRFRIRRPHAVTASAVSVGVQDRERAAATSQGANRQATKIHRALEMYDREGACWYPAQFYSRSMERIRYYPAVLNENGEPEESEDPALIDLFARVRDPGGTSIRGLASNYGRLRFLIGDGYLVASEQDGDEAWEYLSPVELKRDRSTDPQTYTRDDGIEKRTLTEAEKLEQITGDRVRVWRLWRRHPTRTGWSDAPVLSVLDLYETLVSLTLSTGAQALSRVLNGILFLPDEIASGADGEDESGLDEDPEQIPIIREFIEGLTRAVENPGSVAALSPYIMTGPGLLGTEDANGRPFPTVEAIKLISLTSREAYHETAAAEAVIQRIALGLDMPREMLTGTGDVNHWGGWLLDEQGFRQHVAPVVEEFCDDIASAYLRPTALDENIKNAENVVVWYDPVDAVAHPDAFATAKDAWDRFAISNERLRADGGYGDEDAPDDDELSWRIQVALKQVPQELVVAPVTENGDGETAPQDGGTGNDANEGPPADEPGAAADSPPAIASMILGAAEIQVKAARKTAGARLVQRSKNCSECQDQTRDVPHALVANALGPDRVREIINGHGPEASLVAGAGMMLAAQARDWGVSETAAVDLGAMVEAHALRTLYERDVPPLPAGFATAVARAVA